MKSRVWILLGAILVAVFVFYRIPAIPQSEAYHTFADDRPFFGISNCLNVVSNVLFLLVSVLGIRFILQDPSFVDSRERWPYLTFSVGVALTAFGSSYYHVGANDTTLVWTASRWRSASPRSSPPQLPNVST
jgi:hypothetical protein